MYKQNICKFYTPSISDPILIHCFVLESNPENVFHSSALSQNRMLLVTQGQGTLSINNIPSKDMFVNIFLKIFFD